VVADFAYVATWTGFGYVAFVVDVFSRCIIDWRAARSMHAELVLDALGASAVVALGNFETAIIVQLQGFTPDFIEGRSDFKRRLTSTPNESHFGHFRRCAIIGCSA
jgi:hypothetical protein